MPTIIQIFDKPGAVGVYSTLKLFIPTSVIRVVKSREFGPVDTCLTLLHLNYIYNNMHLKHTFRLCFAQTT